MNNFILGLIENHIVVLSMVWEAILEIPEVGAFYIDTVN